MPFQGSLEPEPYECSITRLLNHSLLSLSYLSRERAGEKIEVRSQRSCRVLRSRETKLQRTSHFSTPCQSAAGPATVQPRSSLHDSTMNSLAMFYRAGFADAFEGGGSNGNFLA